MTLKRHRAEWRFLAIDGPYVESKDHLQKVSGHRSSEYLKSFYEGYIEASLRKPADKWVISFNQRNILQYDDLKIIFNPWSKSKRRPRLNCLYFGAHSDTPKGKNGYFEFFGKQAQVSARRVLQLLCKQHVEYLFVPSCYYLDLDQSKRADWIEANLSKNCNISTAAFLVSSREGELFNHDEQILTSRIMTTIWERDLWGTPADKRKTNLIRWFQKDLLDTFSVDFLWKLGFTMAYKTQGSPKLSVWPKEKNDLVRLPKKN